MVDLSPDHAVGMRLNFVRLLYYFDLSFVTGYTHEKKFMHTTATSRFSLQLKCGLNGNAKY
jgi:hypothetical protein